MTSSESVGHGKTCYSTQDAMPMDLNVLRCRTDILETAAQVHCLPVPGLCGVRVTQ